MDDNWLPPRMQDIKPIVQADQKVKELFSSTGRSWDHHKLVEVYGAGNAKQVATIPNLWNILFWDALGLIRSGLPLISNGTLETYRFSN
ncbi:hypothetical protein Pint_13209 [Pistacia integerrima]|uniref:Uncharacterized protein n=1 Tax=Pistacia integerrima TaxID=434235 RepID=A0ACC0Y4B0_9ROSI|nr:hypothetical protein Pint_13209 [Pistacia integerrima]